MGAARRCLGPVRLPVSPHPHEGPCHGAARRSGGRPRGLPHVTCDVETRLAACLELHDLRRARWHVGCRAPDHVQMPLHLILLSPCVKGAARGRGLAQVSLGRRLVRRSRSSRRRARAGPPGVEPGPARLELAMRAVTPRACEADGARPLSDGRSLPEPPAGVEPAPQPYEGCVLPLTPQRREMETAGVEPAIPRCKRGALGR